MSATFRGSKSRDPEDYYKTPRWAVNALLSKLVPLGLTYRSQILDPGIGEGAITDAIVAHRGSDAARGGSIVGIERNVQRVERVRAMNLPSVHVLDGDFLEWGRSSRAPKFDFIIANPPFSLAMEFVEVSLKLAPVVAMLLRLPWLASQGRADFMRKNTPSVLVLPKRPEFVAVVRCVRFVRTKRSDGAQASLPPGCSYEEYMAIEDERPAACPVCGSKVKVTTSDATDYAWFLFGTGSARVEILDVPEDA